MSLDYLRKCQEVGITIERHADAEHFFCEDCNNESFQLTDGSFMQFSPIEAAVIKGTLQRNIQLKKGLCLICGHRRRKE